MKAVVDENAPPRPAGKVVEKVQEEGRSLPAPSFLSLHLLLSVHKAAHGPGDPTPDPRERRIRAPTGNTLRDCSSPDAPAVHRWERDDAETAAYNGLFLADQSGVRDSVPWSPATMKDVHTPTPRAHRV